MTDADRWTIRWPASRPPRLRLLCFPYAGGGASIYRPWREHLPPDVELCGVQLPGRESRLSEPPWYQLSTLIPQLHRGLAGLLDLPYVTFGHSLGALVSFEFVRRLRKHGDPLPRHVFVSGRAAPQVPPRDDPVHQLPDDEFIKAVARFQATRPRRLRAQRAIPLRTRAPVALSDHRVLRDRRPVRAEGGRRGLGNPGRYRLDRACHAGRPLLPAPVAAASAPRDRLVTHLTVQPGGIPCGRPSSSSTTSSTRPTSRR